MAVHLNAITFFLITLFKGCCSRCDYSVYTYYCYTTYYTLSAGAISGIVIGIIVAAGVIVAVIVIYCVRNGCRTPASAGAIVAPPAQGTVPDVVHPQTVTQVVHPQTVSYVTGTAHVNPAFSPGYVQAQNQLTVASAPPYRAPMVRPAPTSPPRTANVLGQSLFALGRLAASDLPGSEFTVPEFSAPDLGDLGGGDFGCEM